MRGLLLNDLFACVVSVCVFDRWPVICLLGYGFVCLRVFDRSAVGSLVG